MFYGKKTLNLWEFPGTENINDREGKKLVGVKQFAVDSSSRPIDNL